jgi:micrococcal nuclease
MLNIVTLRCAGNAAGALSCLNSSTRAESMKRNFAVLSLFLAVLTVNVRAGVLQAVVQTVHDAKTVTVISAGRPVVVILEAVDVPVSNEPFAAISRQHLSDLILGKNVIVEYTGIGEKGRFTAKVVADGIDIGQQMIRDGAACYGRDFDTELSPQERQLYLAAQDAARVEQRGIWQANVLPAPGVWRVPKVAEPETAKPAAGTASAGTPVFSRVPELAYDPRARATSPASEAKKEIVWPMYTPAGAPFSIRVPVGGKQFQTQIRLPSGESVLGDHYMVLHPRLQYVTEWLEAPNELTAIDKNYEEYLQYVEEALHAQGYPCEFYRSSEVSMNGYSGHHYNIRKCGYYGGVRLYHKVQGKQVKIFLVGIVSEEDKNPLVEQFFNSLVVNR